MLVFLRWFRRVTQCVRAGVVEDSADGGAKNASSMIGTMTDDDVYDEDQNERAAGDGHQGGDDTRDDVGDGHDADNDGDGNDGHDACGLQIIY